jgi:hypothetical protein
LTEVAPAGGCCIARSSRVVDHGSQLWAEALEAVLNWDIRQVGILTGAASAGHRAETNARSLTAGLSKMKWLWRRPGHPTCRSGLSEGKRRSWILVRVLGLPKPRLEPMMSRGVELPFGLRHCSTDGGFMAILVLTTLAPLNARRSKMTWQSSE